MKKKYIVVIISIILIALISIIVINIRKNNKTNNGVHYGDFDKETLVGSATIKEKIKTAIGKCKNLYNGTSTFYIYFKIDFINNFMEGSERLVLIQDIDKENFTAVDMYYMDNKILKSFPKEKVEDVERDSVTIEPGKDSIVKVYSTADEVTYYYILNISDKGNCELTDLCYTVGENNESIMVNEGNAIQN